MHHRCAHGSIIKVLPRLRGPGIAGCLNSWNQAPFLFDVGVGTAQSLVAHWRLVRSRGIRVVGVDIDADYVRQAQASLSRFGLDSQAEVRLESVYDHQGGPYDAAYFGASFMLMPDPVAALRHVVSRLRPDGRVFFTQTFQERQSLFAENVKPLLVKLTTIDFGRVTYEGDFLRTVAAAGVAVEQQQLRFRMPGQSFRHIVVRPSA